MATHETWGMLRYERRSETWMGGLMAATFSTLFIGSLGLHRSAVAIALGAGLLSVLVGGVRRVRAPKGYSSPVEGIMVGFGLVVLLAVAITLYLGVVKGIPVRRRIEFGLGL